MTGITKYVLFCQWDGAYKRFLAVNKNSSPCSIGGMFYFLLLSCHLPKERKGNVLFNDALNTFLFTVIWRQAYG